MADPALEYDLLLHELLMQCSGGSTGRPMSWDFSLQSRCINCFVLLVNDIMSALVAKSDLRLFSHYTLVMRWWEQ